jgi:hypothetical protein
LLIEWLPWLLMMRRPGKKMYSWKGLASIEAIKTTKINPAGTRMIPSDSMSLIRNIKVDFPNFHKDNFGGNAEKTETPPLLGNDLASPLNNNHHQSQNHAYDYDAFFSPKQPGLFDHHQRWAPGEGTGGTECTSQRVGKNRRRQQNGKRNVC